MVRRRGFLNEPRTGRKLPAFTALRCPMVGHLPSWCRYLCEPIDGKGICGRLAPHTMLDRTQRAILAYKERQARESA